MLLPTKRRLLNRPRFAFSFLTHAEDASGSSTVTYSGLSGGGEHPFRVLAVYVSARMVTVNTITSVTIFGVPATLVDVPTPGSATSIGGTNGSAGAIYYAKVPSGLTGSVVVVYGAGAARSGIALYRIITSNPAPFSAQNVSTSGALSTSLTISPNGAGIVALFENSNTIAVSWSGATQDYSAIAGGSSLISSATMLATNSVSAGVVTQQIFSGAAWGP